MNVLAVGEGFLQAWHVSHVCGQAKLDLRIVGSQECVAVLGNEGFADLAPYFCTNGNVLKVRIG